MPLTLPVSRSFSISFHVSTWLWLWMISRSPLGSLGNLSSFPASRVSYQAPYTAANELDFYSFPLTFRVHQ